MRPLRIVLLLGLLAGDAGVHAGAARLGEPPAAALSGHVVALASPVDLTVRVAGQQLRFAVRGVREDPVCEPERHLAWARRILAPGTAVELGAPDRWGGRTVRFDWQGRQLDWGFVLLRTGQAFPGGAPDEPARLPEAYAWAAREARAEGRGLWGECGRALLRFRNAAASTGIPGVVLYGIAMTESALAGKPWPWTLNVGGQALRYATRIAAWQELRALDAAGRHDVDVGLMQVNWHYHHQRFASLWQALDPEANQAVAAAIVCAEWQRSGDLAKAVARYHSADPVAGRRYLERVLSYVVSAQAAARSSPMGFSPSAHPSGPERPVCHP